MGEQFWVPYSHVSPIYTCSVAQVSVLYNIQHVQTSYCARPYPCLRVLPVSFHTAFRQASSWPLHTRAVCMPPFRRVLDLSHAEAFSSTLLRISLLRPSKKIRSHDDDTGAAAPSRLSRRSAVSGQGQADGELWPFY